MGILRFSDITVSIYSYSVFWIVYSPDNSLSVGTLLTDSNEVRGGLFRVGEGGKKTSSADWSTSTPHNSLTHWIGS